MRLQICILIPDCIFKEEKVEELLIQSRPSKLGIIKGHVSLIITIDISIMQFRQQLDWIFIVLISGLVFIQNNRTFIYYCEFGGNTLFDKSIFDCESFGNSN